MFDISFSELMVIGVIALIVIGPERLPKVARTVGHLLGRAQRYVNDVKTDIKREIELDELRKFKEQMQDAAQNVQTSLRDAGTALKAPTEELRSELNALNAATAAAATSLTRTANGEPATVGPDPSAGPDATVPAIPPAGPDMPAPAAPRPPAPAPASPVAAPSGEPPDEPQPGDAAQPSLFDDPAPAPAAPAAKTPTGTPT